MDFFSTEKAPQAVGPYSQATASGNLVFVSGQIGLDPATMKIVDGGVEPEAEQVFANLKAVLGAAGLAMDNVVKATVFLMDMGDFQKVNAIYERAFGGHKPARAAIQVAGLPLGARVEVECIAERGA